ncbi:transferrin receptor protein 1 [Eublepharis macularius]|uniref:Transferrin receptor protein 1 n=1 Tax=Eublepharis macularius TaxID=481883 RepID=A0AA97JN35_EUBMA|nr:transferrin receptor protein 1 [Eublepharis macularius]XP_054839991.1 transferrin receptor protein 1 [Eublepharis macularius]XP_054839992.1 transferrin receptor protein 1 [Eublepharis macularius]XP_054839993.1 transferrin receptor protein 1 [Eublepharis macularius]XP_054839994.1 transferrin receptor protein 1 [Eublepharis macularius]
MNHARKAVFNLLGGETLSYTRFSLARQPDGDNSHVEMKLSAEDEEGGENGVIDHVHTRPLKSRNTSRHLCCICSAVALLLLAGFLIGYLSFRTRMPAPAECVNGVQPCQNNLCPSLDVKEPLNSEVEEPEPEPVMYWGDLQKILSEKLRTTSFLEKVRRVSSTSHEAGTAGDEELANYIHTEFSSYKLDKVWNDEHYVRLQVLGSSPNVISMEIPGGNKESLDVSEAYVAYSGNGTVAGKPVYANFGRSEDFNTLMEKKINVSGTVIIVRAGTITFAEKVANAQKWGAVGVLIFPSPADYRELGEGVAQFGHAHLGTGDPFTPGFPSFNHTQFPPAESSGLPRVPVQTISRSAANKLFSHMNGQACPTTWIGTFKAPCKLDSKDAAGVTVSLRVNNELVERRILNVFGVVKGFEEPDRYVVVGAQRDSWGLGAAKAGVGTSILLALARTVSELVKNEGYRPRRSLVFASWSAGDFGAVGATEWLEGYAATLHLKAFAYINLDSAVTGSRDFRFSASPMLKKLLNDAASTVEGPVRLDGMLAGKEEPFRMDNAGFAFLSYSGIPAISFRFTDVDGKEYPHLSTTEDNLDKLLSFFSLSSEKLDRTIRAAAEIAGRMALRMTHDHELYLDFSSYDDKLRDFVFKLAASHRGLQNLGLGLQWLYVARGDFSRATNDLRNAIRNTDLTNKDACRALNDRIMKVEYHFLSPYVSPKDHPLRHIFFGSGSHTLQALLDHLTLLRTNQNAVNEALLRNQLALATWTIQGAANALSGDIWDIDNEF